MELKYKLWGLLLVLSLAQVSRAQLQCYVCENCAEVSATTPLLNCDSDFFNPGGSNEPSTQTTTDTPTGTTEMPTEIITSTSTAVPSTTETRTSTGHSTTTTVRTTESTTSPSTTVTTENTTSPITTTEGPTHNMTTTSSNSSSPTSTTHMTSTTHDAASPSTTEQSTVTTDSTPHMDTTTNVVSEGSEITTRPTENTTSTEPQPPTPPTAHPTSSIPTPPNPGSETPVDDSVKYSVNGTDSDRASIKPYIVSSQFRVRQARSVSEYTYHCFKVTASVNGSMATNRGCSRVKAMESVCGQWKQQHPTGIMNKCHPCSNTRCNGSTALNLSLGALALALVAAVLQRK